MEFDDQLENLSILLIEDDLLLRNSMTAFFTRRTKRFVTAKKAEDAFLLIDKEPFDCIICDYKLPGMNGIRFFEKLADENIKAKKVLISAFIDKKVARKALSTGVDYVISKPFDLKTIISVMVRA